tara:strand:- start:2037 stop:2885 length:849 start_codon:yes stop_codon:yes gene_type:complete
MKLLVDNREPIGLIELLKVRVENIELTNLDIGDFVIKNNDDKIVMIFERKSLNDLMSSIKDGRYNEQSYRLSNYPLDNHNIYYVIEGNISEFIYKNNETNRKILFSSMLSLSYCKGFSLLRATGWLETAEFIIRFMEKLDKIISKNSESKQSNNINMDMQIDNCDSNDVSKLELDNYHFNENLESDWNKSEKQYSDVIKTTKKSFITRDNIGEIMLAQIPGISINVAQSLMREYKNIKNLIICLENNKNCLDDFKIQYKNGSRKISKITIKNLIEYLLEENN